MSKTPIRAVAFDAVGTLIHPEPSAARIYAAVGRRFGSRLSVSEIRSRFGAAFSAQELKDTLARFATSEERERQRWQAIVAQVLDDVTDPKACSNELYAHFGRPDAWHVEDGAVELIDHLRASGYAVAIASNYDHRLRMVLDGIAGLARVQPVVISSEVGWRKPANEFFDHLARALALPPREILFIGDDLENDIDGARQAGMRALLFDPHDRHSAKGIPRLTTLAELSRGSRLQLHS